ncbi:methylenetetrahydrofolate dehydrogenase (NADP+) methenyltetrahydrofolate cyclohydrolase [Liquorilactobacillus cacaonum DSM 21116]|uniref:Bifunctional protein FolD n=2 Tax=Liquorilactobacillus cacaonum TaxID=483012 RepID=A0A0R2CIZ5_9LACO|nr:bifunctional methylenetetrahydrofolate dehydrogenase/methenyltetrahydrofolate cyclohydrolase FolD [Liquorilactobacillus cacaonum]KRM91090.1 methylenetetrahydrofolate dehydrogenase (NADP+) methenyltetrahydrofolate cyclohydrolase [Liquorilactobacillus cacaonum DSM 21116]
MFMAKLLDGRALSKKIKLELHDRVDQLKQGGTVPKLVVILVGDDEASKIYVRNKHKAAEMIGIQTEDIKLPVDTSEKAVLQLIEKFNEDDLVHGILVQLPLPQQINSRKVTEAINPQKDVDGFHPNNVGHLFMGEPRALPCTPNGIIQLLHEYHVPVVGKKAVVIGRSNIVGKPMAAMLLNESATVTVVHSKTKNMKEIIKTADIVVVAIGKAEFITKEYIKPGAVVIDVGMNRNHAGKLVGDVAFSEVESVASYITPVPGGVGPMTIAMLLEQTVRFAELEG